jgi:hypothetical protein
VTSGEVDLVQRENRLKIEVSVKVVRIIPTDHRLMSSEVREPRKAGRAMRQLQASESARLTWLTGVVDNIEYKTKLSAFNVTGGLSLLPSD